MNRAADQKFLALLDVYGADQSRWPADAVRQLAELKGEEAIAAQQALREAKALDRLLARASSVSEARQSSLADRIMAAVHEEAGRHAIATEGSPVSATPAAVSNVIALPTRRNRGAHPVSAQRYAGVDWRAAVAMAAALVIGIGVGMSGTASPTFQAVAETVGVSLERSVLAFNDEHGGTLAALDDEDVL